MKKKSLLILLLGCIGLSGYTQNLSRLFKEVSEVKIKNIGAIKSNEQVKGYFTFYEYDKLDKKNLLYKLTLTDENLNDLGTTDIQGSKELELVSSAFDGINFCFKFWNAKSKTIDMKVFNQQGKEVITNSLPVNYKVNSSNYKLAAFKQFVPEELNVAENNGFVDYSFDNENDAFIVSYTNGNRKSWNQPYQPGDGFRLAMPTFLNGDNKMILTGVSKIGKGIFNTNASNYVLANNVTNGAPLFDVSVDFNENHIVPVNAFFRNDKVTIIGLNYASAKSYQNPPEGLAFIELDKRGKIVKKSITTFEESLGTYLRMENHKLKDDYYLYIHDIVATNRNSNLVVAEKFKKIPGSYIELENIVLIEYDSSNKVIQAKEFPKEKAQAYTLASFSSSPYTAATVAKMYGYMDYLYMLHDETNSEITFSFIDNNKRNPSAKKTRVFEQVKYKDGKMSIDHVSISSQDTDMADFTQIYPAKPGYVLEANFYKKKKELLMRFIKLNN